MATVHYSAFISYSHALDGRLAPALDDALERFAKPWFRRRALHVFRDETSLSANPGLWPSIEAALASSEFFILLASPEAAWSPWVNREVQYWCEHKPRDTLLIALTARTLVWDPDAGDFDWTRTTALPPALEHRLSDEPRHIDLTWARTEEHLSLRHTRFRDCVADLAAPPPPAEGRPRGRGHPPAPAHKAGRGSRRIRSAPPGRGGGRVGDPRGQLGGRGPRPARPRRGPSTRCDRTVRRCARRQRGEKRL